MLKIVIYDEGMGGELFADYLKEELPVVQVIPVIAWNAPDKSRTSRRLAIKTAEEALRPYIGKVDLIVIANHFLTLTGLKHFKSAYPEQNFIGFDLPKLDTFVKRTTFLLTTSSIARKLPFRIYLRTLKRKVKVFNLDDFPKKIDDGELYLRDIRKKIVQCSEERPKEIILAYSHFSILKPQLQYIYGKNLRFHDSYDETYRAIFRILKIRGYRSKKK